MKLRRSTFIVALSALLPALSPLHGQETRQSGAHRHGVAQLNIVLEDRDLLIELISPASNILGFEHAPATAEQKQAVADAVASLEDGDALFAFPQAAGCHAKEALVETGIVQGEEDAHRSHEHDDEEHAAEDSDEHHDEEHEAEEGDEHHDEEHSGQDGDDHSEFNARYRFECRNPGEFTFMDVNLFLKFPGNAEIEAQVIGPAGQFTADLNPDTNRINF